MPSFLQIYFIAGALYSLHVVYSPGFKKRYDVFAETRIVTLSRAQRIFLGCVAVACGTAAWLPILVVGVVAAFIAGANSEWRKPRK